MDDKFFAIFNVVTLGIVVYALKNMRILKNKTKRIAIIIYGVGVLVGIVLQTASLSGENFSIFVGF